MSETIEKAIKLHVNICSARRNMKWIFAAITFLLTSGGWFVYNAIGQEHRTTVLETMQINNQRQIDEGISVSSLLLIKLDKLIVKVDSLNRIKK